MKSLLLKENIATLCNCVITYGLFFALLFFIFKDMTIYASIDLILLISWMMYDAFRVVNKKGENKNE